MSKESTPYLQTAKISERVSVNGVIHPSRRPDLVRDRSESGVRARRDGRAANGRTRRGRSGSVEFGLFVCQVAVELMIISARGSLRGYVQRRRLARTPHAGGADAFGVCVFAFLLSSSLRVGESMDPRLGNRRATLAAAHAAPGGAGAGGVAAARGRATARAVDIASAVEIVCETLGGGVHLTRPAARAALGGETSRTSRVLVGGPPILRRAPGRLSSRRAARKLVRWRSRWKSMAPRSSRPFSRPM